MPVSTALVFYWSAMLHTVVRPGLSLCRLFRGLIMIIITSHIIKSYADIWPVAQVRHCDYYELSLADHLHILQHYTMRLFFSHVPHWI